MRPKGSAQELERRRRRVYGLLQQGLKPAAVARAVGTSRASVSRWQQALSTHGLRALKARPHPGGIPRLTERQRQRLLRLLLQGPVRHGYGTELWTLARIAEVIAVNFGVSYHPSAVWHILHTLGWSCQKPDRRARERDEAAIQRWRRTAWPRIKKTPVKPGGTSCSWMRPA